MDKIFYFIIDILNSDAVNQTIDAGLTVASKLPEGSAAGGALIAFLLLLGLFTIFGLALKGHTGEW